MNLFISYTMNDGIITIEKLHSLKYFLDKKHNVFIHAIESEKRNIGQEEVIQELINSDIIILLFTEGCLNSRWVNLELEIGNHCNIPIISVDAKNSTFDKS
ncbi:TIR domain-containing protein [Citrobacter freundii]|uniref:TIR domain-containing protein n=1 Tax=Citrobacter freundii TaxID=546 RepID=UPI003D367285